MSGTADASRKRLRDVMLRRYLRLGESHTLAEVLGFLSDPHFEKDGLPYLVVIGRDGSLAGMLSPKRIFAALVEDLPEGRERHAAFTEAAPRRLRIQVREVMDTAIPTLGPDEPLESAYRCIQESATEVMAVIGEGRVIGLVTARILFETASLLTVGSLSGGVIPPKD